MLDRSDASSRRAKEARRAVSKELARYHQSLLDAFGGEAASFFDRIMEQADRDIQARREEWASNSEEPIAKKRPAQS
jgi:hypothetical protein